MMVTPVVKSGGLYAPDGAFFAALPYLGILPDAGVWRIELPAENSSGFYTLTLALTRRQPDNDAGLGRDAPPSFDPDVRIPTGIARGELDRFDDADVYLIPLAPGDVARVKVAVDPSAAQYQFLSSSGEPRWPPRLEASEFTINQPNYILRVNRTTPSVEAASYEIHVRHTPAESLATFEQVLPPLDVLDRSTIVASMAPDGENLLVGMADGSIDLVSASGIAPTGIILPSAPESLAALGDGALAYADGRNTLYVRDRAGETTPMARIFPRAGLVQAPDGSLYGYGGDWESQPSLFRTDGTRRIDRIPGGGAWPEFAPDGTLYAKDADQLQRIDLDTLAVVPVYAVTGLSKVAFDGQGFAYVAATEARLILRVDLSTGESTVVARAPHVVDLAVVGDYLYVSSGLHREPALARARVDVPGFGGFHRPIEVAPLPDLSVASISHIRGPGPMEHHTIRAVIENVGRGPSPGTRVDLHVGLSASPYVGDVTSRVRIPEMAPGEIAVVELVWDSLGSAGPHRAEASIDPPSALIEETRSNNVASLEFDVLVHPNG